MIKSFKNKALADLWSNGRSKIDARMHKRILIRLAAINEAGVVADIDLPGYDFHGLHGFNPTRYTVHVNGPWCITFEFEGGNAYRVDFEQYH
ncbi:type II toxin-antitoxin system RelE/ParE family toxin [Mesorhizobium sp. CAU 1732]|uniref:type II toxin-antitoxin system RelE/ParE family toxin n=1 Tax=Mesorhizobium sp. CAU 1732 TaxID=3140358 RepID=UPI00326088E0